jgi:hypothetical protein
VRKTGEEEAMGQGVEIDNPVVVLLGLKGL